MGTAQTCRRIIGRNRSAIPPPQVRYTYVRKGSGNKVDKIELLSSNQRASGGGGGGDATYVLYDRKTELTSHATRMLLLLLFLLLLLLLLFLFLFQNELLFLDQNDSKSELSSVGLNHTFLRWKHS